MTVHANLDTVMRPREIPAVASLSCMRPKAMTEVSSEPSKRRFCQPRCSVMLSRGREERRTVFFSNTSIISTMYSSAPN